MALGSAGGELAARLPGNGHAPCVHDIAPGTLRAQMSTTDEAEVRRRRQTTVHLIRHLREHPTS